MSKSRFDNKITKSFLDNIILTKKSSCGLTEYKDYELFEIPTYVWKTKFPNHEKIKDKIIQSLELTPKAQSHFHKLEKHDYDVPSQYTRLYGEYFCPNFIKIIQPLVQNYEPLNYHYWFNQYDIGESQAYLHIHKGALISGCYFVELENHKDSTIFTNPSLSKGYQIPVKEGDILFWDPMIPHIAPVVEGLKTVISFNLMSS